MLIIEILFHSEKFPIISKRKMFFFHEKTSFRSKSSFDVLIFVKSVRFPMGIAPETFRKCLQLSQASFPFLKIVQYPYIGSWGDSCVQCPQSIEYVRRGGGWFGRIRLQHRQISQASTLNVHNFTSFCPFVLRFHTDQPWVCLC